MKAIKINSAVNLNNGLQIPPGSVVVINEGLAQVVNARDGLIPAQIATGVYTSVSNYESGKAAVDGASISDFNPVNYGVKLPVAAYETNSAQDLLLTAVYIGLSEVYPGQCEVVEVVNPNDIPTPMPEVIPVADGMAASTATVSQPTQADLLSAQYAKAASQINSVDLTLWQRFLNFIQGK
jgi:hypothetical protein